MKNNKYKLSLFFLIPLLACSACQSNTKTSSSEEESKHDPDKDYPGASSIIYDDYYDTTEYNYSKFFYNENHSLNMPDPFVLEEDGVFYIYGTTDRVGSNGVDCYTTTDFHTYKCYAKVSKLEKLFEK